MEVVHNILSLLKYSPDSPMLFSGGLFWVIFLLFIPIYSAIKNKRTQMLIFTVAFSLYFYYKSSGLFFLLLVCTSIIDWTISHLIAKSTSKYRKKALLTLSITISLSVLGYFKYANFFLWNWNQIVENNFQPLDIILPVGISFYTFQSISYVVDVYKQRISPTSSWLEYIFFLSFFPALVAGPIVRADKFLPQLKENRGATHTEIFSGLWLIILGIVKKAIIADYIAQYNDLIFDNPTGYSGLESLMGAIGYTIQIYCDFSGYSDMAIGIALILGFNLGENFRLPYQSKNLTEFWRRWHISLSTWLRDYVYIPLGGNRHGVVRTYINNFLTMLIGGLWHGAAWKFVFWGAMHGVGLAVHKASKPMLEKIPDNFVTKNIFRAITLVFVGMMWIFFRAASFEDSLTIISNIFTNFDIHQLVPFIEVRYTWCIMISVIIMTHMIPYDLHNRIKLWFANTHWTLQLLIFMTVVQLVIQFMGEDIAPFIYFQF